jgi:hypothetical protein
MNSNSTFITGISPEHFPAFVAALLLIPGVWLGLRWLRANARDGEGQAWRLLGRWEAASYARRLTALLLLATGVVHLALPLGHHDAPALTLMFWVSGAAYTWLAFKSLGEGKWRLRASLLLVANIVAYLVVAGSGWQEEPDQVGIATKLIELTALGLIVIPRLEPARGLRRRLARPAASFGFVTLTVVTGLVIWVGSFVAHQHADAAAEAHEHEPGTAVHSHDEGAHHHDFAARAQAGVIMHPGTNEPPTLEQVEAAAMLAADTKTETARYADYEAALADGYVPDGPKLGVQRHLKNKAYQGDGRILDPSKPELLVYGTDGERFVLLGVAYTMEKAGVRGPEVGGSLTRWHTHNICFTLTPPGFGLVSPFGNCPIGAVSVTLPEMMHVWTVDNPDGPYADNLDDKWVKQYLAGSAGE